MLAVFVVCFKLQFDYIFNLSKRQGAYGSSDRLKEGDRQTIGMSLNLSSKSNRVTEYA